MKNKIPAHLLTHCINFREKPKTEELTRKKRSKTGLRLRTMQKIYALCFTTHYNHSVINLIALFGSTQK